MAQWTQAISTWSQDGVLRGTVLYLPAVIVFRKLPDKLAEAACMDGANEWRIFWQIMLPLSEPALAT